MIPIEFPEQTIVWARDGQPDETGKPRYKPLPAFTDERQTVTCWKLDWRERFKLLITGKMWFQQMNFGEKLQPQYMTVDRPFVENK